MEKLWRGARQLERIEARQQQAEAALATQLAAAKPAPNSINDETLALLARQPVPTALLYYLPGDDRLDILLVNGQGRKPWRINVRQADLDAMTARLQAVLRNRGADPRPEARKMYDMLFKSVAGELAGTKVVALSLSGRLRFVPFAAFYDGEQWLAERHALVLHPGTRLADAVKPSAEHWTAAAFGASLGGGASLPPLPGVQRELDSVVRKGNGGDGALPGRALLNAEFTAQALRSALAGDSDVVHIASHFKFEPGDASASFLLLGDGSHLSLRDLGGPAYRFDRKALVTLSACQTGLSEDDSFGQEVDGLAALLMAQGAPSVVASLWQVADDTTAELMRTMYRAREPREAGRPPVALGLALQQAQVAMIRGAAQPARPDAVTKLASVGVDSAGAPARGLTLPQPAGGGSALGLSHPYFWAPFVLMGNWQ
jgi:CHAT domain-containing protein